MINAISLDVLMPRARDILMKKMRPVHYRILTEEACKSLYPNEDISIRDIAEDFRGKGKRFPGEPYGMRYTGGKAGSFVIMTNWICVEKNLFPEDCNINIALRECVNASVETALRMPYMKNKYGSSDIGRAGRIAKGLIIEHHVKKWFFETWPLAVIEADNQEKWSDPCNHDFKLETKSGDVLLVDVSGSKFDGSFGCAAGKPKADIHVFASLDFDSNSVVMHGFVSGKMFTETVPMHEQFPVSALVFWCNCQVLGISFDDMRRFRYTPTPSRTELHNEKQLYLSVSRPRIAR